MLGHFAEALLALAQGVFGLAAVLDFLPQPGVDPAQFARTRPDPRLQGFLGQLQGVFGPLTGDFNGREISQQEEGVQLRSVKIGRAPVEHIERPEVLVIHLNRDPHAGDQPFIGHGGPQLRGEVLEREITGNDPAPPDLGHMPGQPVAEGQAELFEPRGLDSLGDVHADRAATLVTQGDKGGLDPQQTPTDRNHLPEVVIQAVGRGHGHGQVVEHPEFLQLLGQGGFHSAAGRGFRLSAVDFYSHASSRPWKTAIKDLTWGQGRPATDPGGRIRIP